VRRRASRRPGPRRLCRGRLWDEPARPGPVIADPRPGGRPSRRERAGVSLAAWRRTQNGGPQRRGRNRQKPPPARQAQGERGGDDGCRRGRASPHARPSGRMVRLGAAGGGQPTAGRRRLSLGLAGVCRGGPDWPGAIPLRPRPARRRGNRR
jgi:hypothetical protein